MAMFASAVSFDDAWADNLGGMSRAPPERPADSARRAARRSDVEGRPRRSSRRATLYDPDEADLRVCAEALAALSVELQSLRDLCAQQQQQQRVVLYAAVAIILLVLLFTGHSYARLQYATDCLVHWERR